MEGREHFSDGWLEGVLSDLRATDADGFPRSLAGRRDRLRGHARVLRQLLHRRPPARADLSGLLGAVARISARALRVDRASVWLFTEDGSGLACILEVRDDRLHPPTEGELGAEAAPAYMAALTDESALAVRDARSDPRTRELGAYLERHGVGALLDIPIDVPGELMGVVCHEHTDGPRAWHPEEVAFARHVGGLIAVALEAERRVTAERDAVGTEAKYRHLVESLPVTVYSFSLRTGDLDYVSPRIADLGGFDGKAILEGGVAAWLERIHPDDRRLVRHRLSLGAASGLPPEIVYRVRAPGGGLLWIQDSCSVVRNEVGEPVAVQGVLADVTERVDAEARSVEFQRRYRTLLENVDLIAIIIDGEGRATFVNDAFVRLTGRSREALLEGDWFELVLPTETRDGLRARILRDLEENTLAPRFEIELQTRSGERRQLLCAATAMHGPSGELLGAATLGVDVTERRRFDAAVLQQSKLEVLGHLSVSVAHDFNNLLTVLTNALGLIRMRDPGEEIDEELDIMGRAVAQAAELTQSLLLYGKASPLESEELRVDEVLDECRPLLEAVAGETVRLVVEHGSGAAVVRADRTRLKQLVLNLVTNASDACDGARGGAETPGGHGVRVSTRIERLSEGEARRGGALHGGDFLVLEVRDDGPGMDAATAARIFEPFFTTKGKGTGLGLAIVQAVVQQSGGFLTLETRPGEGATFRAWFPVAAEEMSLSAGGDGGREERPRARVLVVAHDPELRERVARTLGAAEFAPTAVDDLAGAISMLGADDIPVVLTEPFLADGSAEVLARSLRMIRPRAHVLLLSTDVDVEATFDGRISDPSDHATLLAAVRAAVRVATGPEARARQRQAGQGA